VAGAADVAAAPDTTDPASAAADATAINARFRIRIAISPCHWCEPLHRDSASTTARPAKGPDPFTRRLTTPEPIG
jgi:hypothetical protein